MAARRGRDDPFRLLSGYLRAVAVAVGEDRSGTETGWTDGSLADRDAQVTKYNSAWGTLPLRDIWLSARSLAAHMADHMFGMAATIDAPRTVFSTASLLRPGLHSGAVAYDIADPALEQHERLRRGMNSRLSSLVEQLNVAQGHPEHQQAIRIQMNEIKVSAEQYGFDFNRSTRSPAKGLANIVWLGDRPERDLRLLERLMDHDDSATSAVVTRITSAVIHAQPHGLSFFWMRDQATMGPNGVGVMPVGVDITMLATLVASIALAAHQLMLRLCETHGWDEAQWRADVAPAMVGLRAMLP